MKSARAVESLGALAHEHRLAIYRLLIRNGPDGLPAGAVGSRVGLTPSSLTFHLQALKRAGRQLFYSADFSAMNDLVGYLTDECCVESAACAPGCEPARKPKSFRVA